MILEFLGHPLLAGDEFIATSEKDLFVRWRPNVHAFFMRIAHPLPGHDPEMTAPSRFGGYPPLSASGGVIVGEDVTHRFLASIGGFPMSRWHRDVANTLGVPASTDGLVFTGMGGFGGRRAITAVDGATGQTRWTFAPEGLPADGQRMASVTISRWVQKVKARRNISLDPNDPDQLGALTKQLADGGYDVSLGSVRVKVPQPTSSLPHGHLSSGGVVVTAGKVYAEVNGTVAALDQRTGSPVWRRPLPENGWVRSMVATADHLLMCVTVGSPTRPALWEQKDHVLGRHRLMAMRLDNGKQEWVEPVPRPGTLALADGMVYFANGDLTALAPGERTYRLAADSDDPKEYLRAKPDENGEMVAGCEPGATEGNAGEIAPHNPAVRGDAAVLRLASDLEPDELLRRVRTRRKASAGLELLIQLDWLDTERKGVRGAGGGLLNPAKTEELLSLFNRIAEEGQPAYFDLAPDFNVYLLHHPEQAEAVRTLLQKAGRAVRQISPGCKILASVNLEAVAGLYGRGLVQPFGKLPKSDAEATSAIDALLNEVDAVGLNSQPQAAFRSAGEVPPDYLLRVRALFPNRMLLLTRLSIDASATGSLARAAQAAYAHRIRQGLYWVNAAFVAPPELEGYPVKPGDPNDKETDPIRQAAETWRRVVYWTHVKELTVKPPWLGPELPNPDGALPELTRR